MGTESFLSMASFVPFISALNKAFLCTEKREGRKERERGEYKRGGEGREIRKTSRFSFVWQGQTFAFVLGFLALWGCRSVNSKNQGVTMEMDYIRLERLVKVFPSCQTHFHHHRYLIFRVFFLMEVDLCVWIEWGWYNPSWWHSNYEVHYCIITTLWGN